MTHFFNETVTGITSTGDILNIDLSNGYAKDFAIYMDRDTETDTINARIFISGDGVKWFVAKDDADADIELITAKVYRLQNCPATYIKIAIAAITGTWNIALVGI